MNRIGAALMFGLTVACLALLWGMFGPVAGILGGVAVVAHTVSLVLIEAN